MNTLKMFGTALAVVSIAAAGCGGGGGGGELSYLDAPGGDAPDAVAVDQYTPEDVGTDTSPEDTGADVTGGDEVEGDSCCIPDDGWDTASDPGQDFGPPDTGDDPGQDTVPADAPSDPGADVPQDPGPGDTGIDVPPPADPIFRVSSLEIVEPELCLDPTGSGECMVGNDLVNAFIAQSLEDPDQPVNLLLRFLPYDTQDPDAVLLVGDGYCEFAGSQQPLSCSFSEEDPPSVLGPPVFVPEGCGNGSDVTPCFQVEADKVEMYLVNLFVAMHKVFMGGQITQGPAMEKGMLDGFVPVNTLKSIQVGIPGSFDVLLYDFVKHLPPEDLDGVKGYWFEFHFQADSTEYGE